MSPTIEQMTYACMGSFVYEYDTKIKPSLNERDYVAAKLSIGNLVAKTAILFERIAKAGHMYLNEELQNRIRGYSDYRKALDALSLLTTSEFEKLDEERKAREINRMIKIINGHVARLDELTEGNNIYDKHRQRAKV